MATLSFRPPYPTFAGNIRFNSNNSYTPQSDGTYLIQDVDWLSAVGAGWEVAQSSFTSLTNLTAFSGGGQASATQLGSSVNQITTTVATAPPYDSVKLPAAVKGTVTSVINNTNNPIQVFGTGTDTINGIVSTGITQPQNSVDLYICGVNGAWNVEPAVGFSGQLFTELAQDNITAKAGGGQVGATQITAQTSRVLTVATTGDSVVLPASAPGLELVLINHGANPMQVYGLGSDTIDDQPSASGVPQMQLSMVIYSCVVTGKWYSDGLAVGFGGPGLQTTSSTNGLTAHAGGGQALATALPSMQNRVTTVATAADSVQLPTAVTGLSIVVINAAAVNSMNVFPVNGGTDQINALGANAAFALAATKVATFYCVNTGQWHTLLSA